MTLKAPYFSTNPATMMNEPINLEQLLLFSKDEIETNEVKKTVTIQDVLRELKSVSVEVDIALDQVFDEDYDKLKETLDDLALRIEQFLMDLY